MSTSPTISQDSFYVVAREPGAEHPALPTWANELDNPAALQSETTGSVERLELNQVPGAFQLLGVLSPRECQALIKLSETLGYLPDAAVSLPRSIRHNHNVTWVADQATTSALWLRCSDALNQQLEPFAGKRALGLNARFRFYRYQVGDYFKPHTDGAWPGSAVIDHELITNAYPDRFSQLSFIVFLSEDYQGGHTQFYLDKNNPERPARGNQSAVVVNVHTPAGGVLCFPHGLHRMHCVHSSEPISSGVKYIIRTDVLFEI